MRRLFLHGVFGDHVQFLRHLVAVVCLKIVVERLAVSGDGTTDTRGMRGEERSYLRTFFLQIEDRECRLPFVGVHTHLRYAHGGVKADILLFQDPFIEALHHHTGGIAEEAGFVIVAICGVALHLKFIPSPCVYLILAAPHGVELEQNSYRFARYVPTADTDRYILRGVPAFEERVVLTEPSIAVSAEIGTEEDHLIRMLFLH